jgi:hypothetical protein
MPFCMVCGEHHQADFCPERGPLHVEKSQQVEADHPSREEAAVDARQAVVAPDQGRADGRAFTPEDLKQETMPDAKPRFDRNRYQRELMRKRRGHGKALDMLMDIHDG